MGKAHPNCRPRQNVYVRGKLSHLRLVFPLTAELTCHQFLLWQENQYFQAFIVDQRAVALQELSGLLVPDRE